MLRRALLFCVLVGLCLGSVLKIYPPFPDPRIVGGSQVDITDHPYQLSLRTISHICGASIISSTWAITAAHCVGSDASRYRLLSGSSDKDLGNAYTVQKIIRHPSYNSRTIDYDVALLQINGEFKLGSTAVPIKLATSELAAGALVNVTGWGATKEGGSVAPHLMRVTVPIVSREQCNDVYKSLNTITQRMICAGVSAGGKDSCQGDSGGPLAANGVLYGIVSWGYGCAKPKYPGVYSNVANLRSWIKANSGV